MSPGVGAGDLSSSGVSPLWPRSRPQRGDCLRGVLGEWHFLKGVFILQRHRRPWFSIPLLSPVWSAVFSSRNQFQVGTSRRHLGEFGLVIALILLGFMERPIRIEIAIDHQRSEFENGFASLSSPHLAPVISMRSWTSGLTYRPTTRSTSCPMRENFTA